MPRTTPDIPNTSGNRSQVVPQQARGGSWGAFVFGGVWALCNGVWFGALSFLACMAPFMVQRYTALNTVATAVGLGMWIYVAVRGRSLAWRHKRWASYEAFDALQRKWSRVAKWVFALGVVAFVVGAVAFFMLLSAGLSAMKG